MLNARKMPRRKVNAGSAHKTGGISREATVPVKPHSGPKVITGLEPRQTLGASFGASGAMVSGAKAPDAGKAEHRQWLRHVMPKAANPTETAEPPPRDGEIRKMVSLTMDGRSKKALQTMEQDLSDAAKEVAELPEDLAGRLTIRACWERGRTLQNNSRKQGRT